MDTPKELDWVKVKLDCSTEAVFRALRKMATEGVVTLQAAKHGPYTYEVSGHLDFQFDVVARYDGSFAKGVQFERNADGLVIVQENTRRGLVPMFTVRPLLDEDGACRLYPDGDPNGQPLYLWQISRKALESLFFET